MADGAEIELYEYEFEYNAQVAENNDEALEGIALGSSAEPVIPDEQGEDADEQGEDADDASESS